MREKLIAALLVGLLAPAQAQYAVPYRTYHGTTGCTSHTQTVSSWGSTQSIASADPDYIGISSWSNTANLACAAGTGNCFADLNSPICSTLAACGTPELVGTSTGFSIPTLATITQVALTIYRWQNTSSCGFGIYTTCIVYTNWVDLCVGAAWSSCTLNQRVAGNRTTWPGSSGAGTETYNGWLVGGWTATEINTALNIGLLLDAENYLGTGGSIDAKTNGWSVTVTYCS